MVETAGMFFTLNIGLPYADNHVFQSHVQCGCVNNFSTWIILWFIYCQECLFLYGQLGLENESAAQPDS